MDLKTVSFLVVLVFASVARSEFINSTRCPRALCLHDLENTTFLCPNSKCNRIPNEFDGEDVKTINLQNNDLTSIELLDFPALEVLDLSNNGIKEIKDKAFFRVQNLKKLNLSDNQLDQSDLEGVTGDHVFFGVKSLEELYLARNRISNLDRPNIFFVELMASLKILDLSQNRIEKLDNNALTDLNALTLLDLSGNQITNLKSNHLMGLSKLLQIDISSNRLQKLTKKLFHGCSSLLVADLRKNFIEEISLDAFTNTMEILHLEGNSITHLTSRMFTFGRFKEIYLDGNPILKIDAGAFGLSLMSVSIQSSLKLTEIPAGAFTGLKNLENVTISNNKYLATISPDAFGGVESDVKNFNLSKNALTKLTPGLLKWDNLTTFDLSGNSWDCDCEMVWLKQSYLGDYIVCYRPLHLTNLKLSSLEDSSLSCNPAVKYKREGAILLAVAFSVAFFGVIACLLRRHSRKVRRFLTGPQGNYETLYNKNESVNSTDDDPSETININIKTTEDAKIASV